MLGGTQGLTFSAAKFLHAAGVRLALNGRNEESGRAAVAALGENAAFVQGDVADATQSAFIHERAAKALGGPVSILVTNAGGPPPANSSSTTRRRGTKRARNQHVLGAAHGAPRAARNDRAGLGAHRQRHLVLGA